jgi:hypothetical protein
MSKIGWLKQIHPPIKFFYDCNQLRVRRKTVFDIMPCQWLYITIGAIAEVIRKRT